jgi:hypothetical protein
VLQRPGLCDNATITVQADKRPFSRGEREDYSDVGIRTLDPQQVPADAMGGHGPRLWIDQRTGSSAVAVFG